MTTRYAQVHAKPAGPGDARPTALQIVKDEGLENKMANKTILITGVSSGLGVEASKVLFETGATLYLTARDLSKAEKALGDIVKSDRVHLLSLDLASFASVRACAKDFLSKSPKLNVFIANAGVMNPPEGRTEDGFETQFGSNHLGHFLLFKLLQPALLAASIPEFNSRAVFLSSVAHRFGEVPFDNYNFDGCYNKFLAYSSSKTANLWTANEIDRLYGSQGLHAFSVHPGGILTGLIQHMSSEELQGMDPSLAPLLKSPEQGAATEVWAAISASLEGMGGKYLEDVQISKPYDASGGMWGPGYAEYAYSPEKERKLWELSLKLVGEKE